MKPLPLCSDPLWAVGARPSEQGVTGVTWVLENGFYLVPTVNGVQGVRGGEWCTSDLCCVDVSPLLLLCFHTQ